MPSMSVDFLPLFLVVFFLAVLVVFLVALFVKDQDVLLHSCVMRRVF